MFVFILMTQLDHINLYILYIEIKKNKILIKILHISIKIKNIYH